MTRYCFYCSNLMQISTCVRLTCTTVTRFVYWYQIFSILCLSQIELSLFYQSATKSLKILFQYFNFLISCASKVSQYIFYKILTAVLVGNTQSYISIPNALHTIRSTANPTPIRYRGLSFGRIFVDR